MLTQILIGLAAGVASALLYFAVTTGTALALALFYIAPLPVIIAGLGWGWMTALVAAMSGAAFAGIMTAPLLGLAFLAACGAPAAWLTRLTLLGRPVNRDDPASPIEWYPAGRLVLWIVALGCGVVLFATMIMSGGTDALRQSIAEALERLAGEEAGAAFGLGEDVDITEMAAALASVLPAIATAIWILTMLLNLWIGGRIAIAAGLLQRPIPGARDIDYPTAAAFVFAASLVAAFMPGLPGLVAGVLTAALTVAYFLLGLAVIHVLTQGMNGRLFILAALYLTILVLVWTIPLIAALGVAETFLQLRRRRNPAGPPGPATP